MSEDGPADEPSGDAEAEGPPQPGGLISVLLDPAARADERDDAAIDLGGFDSPEAEAALLKCLADHPGHEVVRASCGASLAEIWCRRGSLARDDYAGLPEPALAEATAVIRRERPEWLS